MPKIKIKFSQAGRSKERRSKMSVGETIHQSFQNNFLKNQFLCSDCSDFWDHQSLISFSLQFCFSPHKKVFKSLPESFGQQKLPRKAIWLGLTTCKRHRLRQAKQTLNKLEQGFVLQPQGGIASPMQKRDICKNRSPEKQKNKIGTCRTMTDFANS